MEPASLALTPKSKVCSTYPVFWQSTRNIEQGMVGARAFFQALESFHLPPRFRSEIIWVLCWFLLSQSQSQQKSFLFQRGNFKWFAYYSRSPKKIEYPKAMLLWGNGLSCKLCQLGRQSPAFPIGFWVGALEKSCKAPCHGLMDFLPRPSGSCRFGPCCYEKRAVQALALILSFSFAMKFKLLPDSWHWLVPKKAAR